MDFEQHIYGMTEEGEAAILYVMRAECGAEVHLTNYGASVVALKMPNAEGEIVDLLPPRRDFEQMQRERTTAFRTIGRAATEAPSTLHNKIWEARFETNRIVMSYLSVDGDGGHDGNLNIEAIFDFDDELLFEVTYLAKSDMTTRVNLSLDMQLDNELPSTPAKCQEQSAGELYSNRIAYKF